MSMQSKTVNQKLGLVIKLSSETLLKLSEDSSDANDVKKGNQENNDNGGNPPPKLSNTDLPASSTTDANTTIKDKSEPGTKPSTNDTNISKNFSIETSTTDDIVHPNAKIPGETDKDVTQNESSVNWGDYAPYVTYEGETAIYTDPTSKVQYVWCNSSSSWIPRDMHNPTQSDITERVYSYENDTHVYTDSDGSKYFWDSDKKAWFPKVDDDFLAHYQMSYGFVDNTSKPEEPIDKGTGKNNSDSGPPKRKLPEQPKWFDASEGYNTKVYVSNLPLDLTEEEFVNIMQKCGLVMRDPSSQKMKIKLYMDKENNCFKGDALCTYIKIESVELALKLLDGSDVKGHKIIVQRAHFQMKGDYNPALKPKKKKKKELEKLKRMQEKLFDWRPEKIETGERSKNERVVIIKNLFDPTDFDKEVQLILDYQQDLREECSKCGEVRKVVLYDRHPEGVAQITMKEAEQADAVIQLINGRWFGKRKLSAEIWDGKTKFKIAETDADINKRVDKWEKFLEGAEASNPPENVTQNSDTSISDQIPEATGSVAVEIDK